MSYDNYDSRYAPPSNGLGLGMSIAGLVVGILALILSFVPCVGWLAFWPGVLAALLSLVGTMALRNGKGLGIAALLISLGSVGLAVKQYMLIHEIADDLEKRLKDDKKKSDAVADAGTGDTDKRGKAGTKSGDKAPPDSTTADPPEEKKRGGTKRPVEKKVRQPVTVTAQTDLGGFTVPELIEQLDSNKQVQLRTRIIFELGKRGADAADALPKLKELAEDPALEQPAKFAIKKIENP